jgi:monofunctional glycosyltransferase
MKKLPIIFFCTIFVFPLSIGRYFFFPDVGFLKKNNPSKTSFMKFRERAWVKNGRTTKATLKWVPYENISKNMVHAVIIAEDAKFWDHDGFDFDAIRNALGRDIKAMKFKVGASTITQQLAKNLFLGPSKNPVRKLDEAILTWRLERTLSKKRIIELYLNVVEWGDGVFGIGNASQHYFTKPAADLDANEASRLAAVLPNPIRYNPLSGRRYVVRRSALIYRSLTIKQPASPAGMKPVTIPKDSMAFLQGPSQEGNDSLLKSVIDMIPDTTVYNDGISRDSIVDP